MALRRRRHVGAGPREDLREGHGILREVALRVGVRHVAGDRRLAHRQVAGVQRGEIEQVDPRHANPSMPVTPSRPETTRRPALPRNGGFRSATLSEAGEPCGNAGGDFPWGNPPRHPALPAGGRHRMAGDGEAARFPGPGRDPKDGAALASTSHELDRSSRRSGSPLPQSRPPLHDSIRRTYGPAPDGPGVFDPGRVILQAVILWTSASSTAETGSSSRTPPPRSTRPPARRTLHVLVDRAWRGRTACCVECSEGRRPHPLPIADLLRDGTGATPSLN